MTAATEKELAALHFMVGHCHPGMADRAKARQSYEESARLAEQAGDKWLLAAALTNIGGIQLRDGEFEASLASSQRAISPARELGELKTQAVALNHAAGYYMMKEQPAQAVPFLLEALELNEKLGDRKEQAGMLANLGAVATEMKEPDKALGYLDRALSIARESGEKGIEAATHADLATHWHERDPDKALGHMEEALRLWTEDGSEQGQAMMHGGIGDLLASRGEHGKAVPHLVKALSLIEQIGNWSWSGLDNDRKALAGCLTAMGQQRFVAACLSTGMQPHEAEELVSGLK
jgi:tetratricopeptide (TPR) repeat protein